MSQILDMNTALIIIFAPRHIQDVLQKHSILKMQQFTLINFLTNAQCSIIHF